MSIPAPHIPPLLSHFEPMRLIGPLPPHCLYIQFPLLPLSLAPTTASINSPFLSCPPIFCHPFCGDFPCASFMRLATVCQVKSLKKFASLSFFFLPWVCGHMNASCCKNKSCFGPLPMAQKGTPEKEGMEHGRVKTKNPFFLFQLCVGELGGGGGGERNFRFCLLLSRSAIAHSPPRPIVEQVTAKRGGI